ncbi:uncharacterized protein LOC127135753 [Lathyrus oleraceus]|uniref:uncharacterized protein LOC127135753 n=1 Tax=Pisum sativum TaxID=3888 RepID=UPI0021CFC8E1|nr:uncharacterized protein LOC127135753 [Pisum sativum]
MLAQDPLEEIDHGNRSTKRITYISSKLDPKLKVRVIELLRENKDCFAWDYDEMPATPKDEYPMPVAEILVDSAAGYEYLSMLDGYSGYNQIFIAEEDVSKTTFRCLGAIGTYEWIVMPFGLKNDGATYQRAMNSIFHDYIETFMQVYIDDVVAGDFLGFVVHKTGIEINQNKTKAIMETKTPSTKKELQSLFGKINFLRRFISNLSGRTQAFSPLIRLKQGKFEWNDEHQKAFDKIKHYLTNPPILAPPCGNKPMRPGQIVSDFIVDHAVVEIPQLQVELKPWRLFFDGSTHKDGSGVGIMLLKKFEYIDIKHVPRIKNQEANDLAQIASGYRISKGKLEELVEVRGKAMAARLSLTDLESTQLGYASKEEFEVLAIDTLIDTDLRNPIIIYLKDPSADTERKTKYRDLSYVLMGNELFKKTPEGILLKCLGENEAYLALSSVHSGACGAHQVGYKMKWLLFRYGMYWPTMLKDCIEFAKGCQECQIHAGIQHAPLTFGYDAVLLVEIYLQSVRIQRQGEIPSDLYWEMMINELVDLDEERLHALEVLRIQKERVARAYNKRVKGKTFTMNDLVWKVILPMDRKNKALGKWSPHWEGPFRIIKAFSNNAYEIEELTEDRKILKVNGKYLKKYKPFMHEVKIITT